MQVTDLPFAFCASYLIPRVKFSMEVFEVQQTVQQGIGLLFV